MRDLVVFGAGEIAELADFYFRHDSDRTVAAFVVDGAYLKEPTFSGRPVIATEEVVGRFKPNEHDAFVAVSYSGVNAVRTAKVAAMREAGYAIASYVSSRATTFPGFAPGPNAFILEDNTIQPFVRIGENVTLWSGNHIGHHSVIEDNCFLASHIVVSGGVTVGRGSFIGVNATLRDHIRIGERCVIGAGACVMKNLDDEAVMPAPGGEPAKIKSSRLRGI
jgi:sugar O-acyltransferase (sialic acid O-acetyltransferase NeuD family)